MLAGEAPTTQGTTMASRVCKTCPAIIPTTSYRGQCPACRTRYNQQRGTPADRGYDADHRAERAALADQLARDGHLTCWRCQQPIHPGDEWHLGHNDDRTTTLGPEHARTCNLRAAGHASHPPA